MYLKCANFRELKKNCISRGLIFTKQTKYCIKQKSNGPKMNEEEKKERFLKKNSARIYFRETRLSKYFERI